MKVICSGCGIYLGHKQSDNYDAEMISHGLCDSCAHHFKSQIGMPLTEYLEGLDVPVTTVTPDGIVGTANQEACFMLGKTLDKIRGKRGGDVFECEYARLPGGCGQTVHCSGCTIRNTVMDTVQNGKSHTNVPAVLNKYGEDRSTQVELFISTKKVGGIVFLKVG